ncbi:MAG: CHAT domain-containing protein [Pseudorhodobacter sp.]
MRLPSFPFPRPFNRLFRVALLAALPWPALATDAETEADLRAAAFEGAQWIMFSSAARAVAGVGARLAAGDDALGALIRDRQDLELMLQAQAGVLDADLAEGRDTEAARAALRETRAHYAALEAELSARFPDYAEFSVPQPMSLAETRATLRAGEALVLILPGPTGTYVWAVSQKGETWARSGFGRDTLADQVRALRRTLDPTGPARSAVALEGPDTAPGFDRSLAHDLYQGLLAGVAPVLAEARRVYVVAEGPLASLPLSVLVTEAPLGDDADPLALRDTAWLVRRHALVTLPSVTSLRSLRAGQGPGAARAPRPPRFVGIGAPVLSGDEGGALVMASRGGLVQGVFGDPDAIRALPALPGTARELRAIARAFPPEAVTLLLGPEARESALPGAGLEAATIISFATHGLVSGELAGLAEPALVLTPPDVAGPGDDGLLTASEAATLRLSADWVILSACNTAAGEDLGAESLSGLARAFFFAGARSLLVSHWPVRDDAAAAMVSDAVRLQAEDGLGRAEALQAAMLALMERPRSGFSHPSAWAPFVLVGEGDS